MHGSSWKRLFTPALIAVLPLALGACEPAGQNGEVGTDGEPMEQEQQEMQEMGQEETVSFEAMNESGVSGEADFTRQGNSLEVVVEAHDLGGPGDYPSHIHEGTCDEPGGVVTPLNSATAEEPGIGEASTEVDAGQLQAGSDYLVMVHATQGEPVACAEVPESIVSAS